MTFDFAYSVAYNFDLAPETVANTSAALARAADRTTGGEPDAWELFVRGNEIGVAFWCEGCRDRFIEIYERAVRRGQAENDPAVSTKRIRGRSRRPRCR